MPSLCKIEHRQHTSDGTLTGSPLPAPTPTTPTRPTLVNQVNERIAQYAEEDHAHDLLDQDPSRRWDRLIEHVTRIGKPLFGAKTKPFHSDEYREMAAQRDQLLTLQRAIRQQAQHESTSLPSPNEAHDAASSA